MTNPYRAMCAELVELCTPVDSIPQLAERLQKLNALGDRARTLLAQPVAEGPTDEELAASRHPTPAAEGEVAEVAAWLRLFCSEEYESRTLDPDFAWLTRAAELLERPAPQPVAVSERPWERDGWCDAEGRCYGWDGDYWWMVGNPRASEIMTHWLPANALPTPEATND